LGPDPFISTCLQRLFGAIILLTSSRNNRAIHASRYTLLQKAEPIRRVFVSPRLSWVALVLTLPRQKEEGHLAYRSRSEHPWQGTTLSTRNRIPRREHTRDAIARAQARRSDRRQWRVPRSGDLADTVLSLANAFPALWSRRRASPSLACAARAR